MSGDKKVKSGRARKRSTSGASKTTDERSEIMKAWADGKSLRQISESTGKPIHEINEVLKVAMKEIVKAVRETHEQIEKNRGEIHLLGEETRRLIDELLDELKVA